MDRGLVTLLHSSSQQEARLSRVIGIDGGARMTRVTHLVWLKVEILPDLACTYWLHACLVSDGWETSLSTGPSRPSVRRRLAE